MDHRRVEIAKWLYQSQVDSAKAGRITGLPESEINRMNRVVDHHFRRVFLPSELTMAIAGLIAGKGEICVVQVGANDGKTGDPVFDIINRFAHTAILIEPQSSLIGRLRENYSNFTGRLVVECKAVSREPGELVLHTVAPEYEEEYWRVVRRDPSQIASIDRRQVLKRVARRLNLEGKAAENAVASEAIPSLPLSEICSQHEVCEIDLLQVDAEGYDFHVIKSLGDLRPAIINFESVNLSPEDWAAFQLWAEEAGYGYIQGSHDTLAIRQFGAKFDL